VLRTEVRRVPLDCVEDFGSGFAICVVGMAVVPSGNFVLADRGDIIVEMNNWA
jgi:hypothetical protein